MKIEEAEGEAAYEGKGFGERIGFGRRPALLVIDFMVAFTDPQMPLGAELSAEIAATNRIVEAARERGIPIFFATVSYDDPELRDAGIWRLKQKGLRTLRSGTPEIAIDPRLDRQAGDIVFVKKFASCFFGTSLATMLHSEGIDTLVVTGCTTSGCVRATAVDACQHGFRPIVVSDAVGDRSQRAHEQSLIDLAFKYADVMDADEVVAVIDRARD